MFVLFVDMKIKPGSQQALEKTYTRRFALQFPGRKAFAVWSCCDRTRTVANSGSASLSSPVLCRRSGWRAICTRTYGRRWKAIVRTILGERLHLGLRSPMERNVPEYVSRSVPVPLTGRLPWYKSTFPSYFGIFLFVGYYLKLAGPTIGYASVTVSCGGWWCRAALLWALLLRAGDAGHADGTHALRGWHFNLWNYRRIFHPGNTDGPVAGWLGGGGRRGCTSFIMKGLGQTSRTLYSVIALVWLYSLGWVAIKGIHYVAQVAKILNWVPFLMILVVLGPTGAVFPTTSRR